MFEMLTADELKALDDLFAHELRDLKNLSAHVQLFTAPMLEAWGYRNQAHMVSAINWFMMDLQVYRSMIDWAKIDLRGTPVS